MPAGRVRWEKPIRYGFNRAWGGAPSRTVVAWDLQNRVIFQAGYKI
jgi:hypothetical protein